MTHANEALILRDQKGDIYVITPETLKAGMVPSDKKQALQEALSGDVAGFLFDATSFQNAFTGLSQNNTNIGQNFAAGGVIGLNNQSLSQLGVNVGSATTNQLKG